MQVNKNIERALNQGKTILKFFIVFQIISMLIMYAIVSSFSFSDTSGEDTSIISKLFPCMLMGVAALVYIRMDVALWKLKISRLENLLYTKPIKCVVEDIVAECYRHDGKKRYKAKFLVRGLDDDKLYFTFGDYSASYYNTRYVNLKTTSLGISAYKKDRTPVELGDIVHIYICDMLNVSVDVDYGKNTVKLDGKKYVYKNANENYDARVFENVRFFAGVVDIESDK